MKKMMTLLAAVLLLALCLTGCGDDGTYDNGAYAIPDELQAMYDGFIGNIDTDYGYEIAYELSTNPEYFSTPDLGGRNAGSEAEHKAADYLVGVMKDLGLEDVQKEGAPCDIFDARGASLVIDGKEYKVYSYEARGTDADGITSEIVYVGTGTAAEYEGLDVKGKIVLADVNQRADWWVTYPMLEAEHQGAAAILFAQTGGFAEIADDALNSNDICAPMSIPACSIGAADAKELQEKIKVGSATGTLTVNNITSDKGDGITYNVYGTIKGKSSENRVIFGAHYDCHFYGFQDDNCAVAEVLTIAKAMKDSGYVPENDIVFCLHGAEEWGGYGTQYDWTVGAWEMINNMHPEWIGTTLAFINFELPAYKFAEYVYSNTAPAFYNMIDFYSNTYPLSADKSIYSEGVKTEGYQAYTYSDDFSYYLAGVPTVINGFLLQEDQETVHDFYNKLYHTNYDTPDLWDADVFRFNAEYYGAMGIYFDQMPALYLDFTGDYERIKAAFNEELLAEYGVDTESYSANLEAFGEAAKANAAKVVEINDAYMKAWSDGDAEAIEALKAEGKALTKTNLEAFKFVSETLVSTMYEKPVVPHEASQINIETMDTIICLLEEGDINTAVDKYVWTVNNVIEWYSWYFSPEVLAIQDECLWGDDEKMYWGTDTSFVKADVYDASVGLFNKYGTTEDTSAEQQIYKNAIEQQAEVMVEYANREIADLQTLADKLGV